MSPATRNAIVVHHSLTADGSTVSWGAIERYHRAWKYAGKEVGEATARRMIAEGAAGVERPWSDIGYHAGVEVVDSSMQVQSLLGRDWSQAAAACPQGGMNLTGLHVCVVGNFDLKPPSPEVLEALVARVLRPWMHLFAIPAERIFGHRDFNPHKTCPGSFFDLEALRRTCR